MNIATIEKKLISHIKFVKLKKDYFNKLKIKLLLIKIYYSRQDNECYINKIDMNNNTKTESC